MTLEIEEKGGKIFIEESTESNGGWRIELLSSSCILSEIKQYSGEECYSGQYADLYEAIKVGRSWT